jgi:FAD/FMN-containing dehydrogenase
MRARGQLEAALLQPQAVCYYECNISVLGARAADMNKIASYLQEHLHGEILTTDEARQYFATDASVLEVKPSMVIYPQNTNDIRKLVRFSWQLAEKGHVLPITARGRGSDLGGAAIGKGIVVVFPVHINRLLELNIKQRRVRVQPGINYRVLQQTIQSHGYFLPPYPSSIDYSTIGGAIANNTAGEKSVKYGDTRDYVDSLEVVLANGELIQTGRLSKRELNRKKGLTNLEGDIYRQLDGLIVDNLELINGHADPAVSKNASGYELATVKHKDGSFDLTPLFVGSQGTLGIISEAILKLEPYNSKTTLFAIFFDELGAASDAVTQILKLDPSALEMVDKHLLELLHKVSPAWLKGVVEEPYPAIVLLVEFDDASAHKQSVQAKKLEKLLKQFAVKYNISTAFDDQQRLWSIRHSAAVVAAYAEGGARAVPIIEDGIVPRERFSEFIEQIYALFNKHHLEVAVWGHAGDANVHLQPFLDLSKVGDRQKVFKLMDEYYDLVLAMGGSTCGEHNDGRIRAPYLKKSYGPEMYELFRQVKRIFDPFGTLNTGVKIDVDVADLVPLLRHEYSLPHLADHLPQI